MARKVYYLGFCSSRRVTVNDIYLLGFNCVLYMSVVAKNIWVKKLQSLLEPVGILSGYFPVLPRQYCATQ